MGREIRPDYYKREGIEVFDVIDAFDLDFFLGNVTKYVCRAGKKGDMLEDLIKARTYLDKEIERLLALDYYKDSPYQNK